MPIRKKLTASLREKIKSNPRKFKKSELSGEALTYLNRVRGAAKARRIKKDTTVKAGGHTIPKNSSAYKIIEALARGRGVTPAQYVKRHPEATRDFLKKGRFYFNRETDHLKTDTENIGGSKIYVNGKLTPKSKAKYYLTRLKNKMSHLLDMYDVVNIEHSYDGNGNLYLKIPFPSEYKNITDPEDLEYFLDRNYPDIQYYLRGTKGQTIKTDLDDDD